MIPVPLQALAEFPQFIWYKLVPDTTRPGKTKKFPVNPRTGEVSSALDPANWMTAEQAYDKGWPVGFAFTRSDPFFFIDLDDCLVNGEWSDTAQDIVEMFPGAAVEVSQSGRGLHIIGKGAAPEHACDVPGRGFYTQDRFVALTGTSILGDAGSDHTVALGQFVPRYFPPSERGELADWTNGPCTGWNGPVDDEKLIARALRSSSVRSVFGGAASFSDLWNSDGDALARAYPADGRAYDGSSADSALAQHLAFWTGLDCARIERLMWLSSLKRDKWQRDDYLYRTILKACSRPNAAFLKDKPEPVAPVATTNVATAVATNTFLGPEEQVRLFQGCVYIVGQHKILVPGGRLLKPDQFRAVYGGYSFLMDNRNERTSRNAWEVFTESQAVRFPRADSVCFKPSLPAAEIVADAGRTRANLWWPIDVPSEEGDVSPILDHLARILPDERDREILLSYMCAVVQHRGVKFQWAPLLQGVEGNGKTLYTRLVAEAVGKRYVHMPRADQISNNFNAWIYGKVFIGIEDIYIPASNSEILEVLKPMISNEDQEVTSKGVDQENLDICANLMMNCNSLSGVKKTRNDRRICTLNTEQQQFSDLARDGMSGDYFPNLYRWLKGGGYAVVTRYLQTRPIQDEFNPATNCQRAPITSTTESAIQNGLGWVEQEILEQVEQELPGFKNGWISSIQLDKLLTRIGAVKYYSYQKRATLLASLGYFPHRNLSKGRPNNAILPDQGRPRLFIKPEHPAFSLSISTEICDRYTSDQS